MRLIISCHILAFQTTPLASMKTIVMPEADSLSDEQLVERTLEGDREAFGQIVARYQSPICVIRP